MARQFGFQYQADSEVVQLRGARVYRGDGRVDEAIESGEGAADDPTISMYTSARNFYIQFPRLDPGDVVELRYRVDDVTPRNEFADYFGEVTYMQSTEPVQNAEYVLITPKKRTFYIDEKVPNLKHDTREVGEQRIYRFTADKLAPIVPEPAMPAFPEVAGFVHVSTFKSYKELGRWYWGFVKEQFDLDDETRKLAREIAKNAKTERDKIRAVYDWVVQSTRYVALEFGIYGYKPRRCVQTVARGWGDCKDKATVIVTLLKELGIPSTIVILRTQLRGDFNSKIPSLAPFDHAIVYVPSQSLYLDGTAEYTGSTELPDMDAGALGLQVNEGDSKLVHLPDLDPKQNLVSRTITVNLAANGDAKLDLDYETHGASASDWRRRYHAESTRRDRVANDLGREFPGFEILPGAAGISTGNLEDVEQPVKIKVHGNARGFARKDAEALSMSATPSLRLTPTYASLSQRKQDLRILGFSTSDDTFVFKLPAGHKVRTAPVGSEATSPFGSYKVEVHQSAGQISVRTRVEIGTPRITPKQYPAWKKFCEDVDRALAARLVVGP
jgi:transglutaminase-like putative cysteine protease